VCCSGPKLRLCSDFAARIQGIRGREEQQKGFELDIEEGAELEDELYEKVWRVPASSCEFLR